MDIRLSAGKRCDYDRSGTLVRRPVEQIAATMHTRGAGYPGWTSTGSRHRCSRSQSLLNGLLKEAILEDFSIDGTDYIRFGYERLSDIALAKLIATKDLDEVKVDVSRLVERWWPTRGCCRPWPRACPRRTGRAGRRAPDLTRRVPP